MDTWSSTRPPGGTTSAAGNSAPSAPRTIAVPNNWVPAGRPGTNVSTWLAVARRLPTRYVSVKAIGEACTNAEASHVKTGTAGSDSTVPDASTQGAPAEAADALTQVQRYEAGTASPAGSLHPVALSTTDPDPAGTARRAPPATTARSRATADTRVTRRKATAAGAPAPVMVALAAVAVHRKRYVTFHASANGGMKRTRGSLVERTATAVVEAPVPVTGGSTCVHANTTPRDSTVGAPPAPLDAAHALPSAKNGSRSPTARDTSGKCRGCTSCVGPSSRSSGIGEADVFTSSQGLWAGAGNGAGRGSARRE